MNVKHVFTSTLLGSIPELTALSCHEIKTSEGKHTIGGKYWLNLTRKGTEKLIYCDMVNKGKSYNFAWVILFVTSYQYHEIIMNYIIIDVIIVIFGLDQLYSLTVLTAWKTWVSLLPHGKIWYPALTPISV